MQKSFESGVGRASYGNHNFELEDNAESEDEKRYLQMVAGAVYAAVIYEKRALLLAGTSNRTGNIRSLLK